MDPVVGPAGSAAIGAPQPIRLGVDPFGNTRRFREATGKLARDGLSIRYDAWTESAGTVN